jgi:hypothetical protein
MRPAVVDVFRPEEPELLELASAAAPRGANPEATAPALGMRRRPEPPTHDPMMPLASAAPRRVAVVSLFSLFAVPGIAQIPTNSVVVLSVAGGVRSLSHVALTPGAVPVPITGLAAPLDAIASQVALDPTSGDLLVGTTTGDLHRVVLAGNTVASDVVLATLANGDVRDIHRDATGAFFTVSDDGSGNPIVHRVSLTPAAATVDFVATSGLPTNAGSFQAGIATDGVGNIVVGVRNPPQSGGGTIATYLPASGMPAGTTSTTFFLNDVDVGPSGQVRASGVAPAIASPNNVFCGGVEFQVGPPPTPFNFPFIATIVSLPNGDLGFGFNGGGSGVSVVAMSGCTNGTESVVYTNPPGTGVFDLHLRARSNLYGSPCVDTQGNWPLIAHTSPPALGTNWVVTLDRARANTLASIFVGTNNTSFQGAMLPLPVGGGCGLLSSGDLLQVQTTTNASGQATFTMAIPNTPGLIGTRMFAQWLYTDAGVNQYDVAMSSGLAAAIQ